MIIYDYLLVVAFVIVLDVFRKYLHELSHKRKFERYDINAQIEVDIKKLAQFKCSIDRKYHDRFNRLSITSKKEILLAGIKVDWLFTFIYLIFFLFSLFLNIKLIEFIVIMVFGFTAFVLSFVSAVINSCPFMKGSDMWNYISFKEGRKLDST